MNVYFFINSIYYLFLYGIRYFCLLLFMVIIFSVYLSDVGKVDV